MDLQYNTPISIRGFCITENYTRGRHDFSTDGELLM